MPNSPVSDQVLDRLRATAAMTLAIPQLAVRLRVGDETCLEVRRTPAPGVRHRVMPPCMFHVAVAEAVRMRRAGEQIAMRGLPDGFEPAIDWGVPAGGKVLPGGVVRVADGPAWIHAAAVLGEEDLVNAAVRKPAAISGHRDDPLGVTVLHGTTPRGDNAASHRTVDALLEVMAQVGVGDLERRLGGHGPAMAERRS